MAERTITLKLTLHEEAALARAMAQISRQITYGKEPLIPRDDYDALGRVNAALNSARRDR